MTPDLQGWMTPTQTIGFCGIFVHAKLVGGFKYFVFSTLPGEMIQFDEHIFQVGWNHQLVNPVCFGGGIPMPSRWLEVCVDAPHRLGDGYVPWRPLTALTLVLQKSGLKETTRDVF